MSSDRPARAFPCTIHHIAHDSVRYANLQLERLVSRVERAASMPSRGYPVHEAIESDLREVHEGSYQIIYRTQDHDLQVVIVHMKQRLTQKRLR